MQRYFLNVGPSTSPLTLPSDVAHHLTTVLRAQVGTEIEVVLNNHLAYHARVRTTAPTTTVDLLAPLDRQSELPVRVTLLCGLPKTKEKPELIVQKATELGLFSLRPSVRLATGQAISRRGRLVVCKRSPMRRRNNPTVTTSPRLPIILA